MSGAAVPLFSLRRGTQNRRREQRLKTTTLRDFTGGLNLSDSDFNMDPRYSTVLDNWLRREDGSMGKRRGTRLFCNFDAHDEIFDIGPNKIIWPPTFDTSIGSNVVTVTRNATPSGYSDAAGEHGLVSGHVVSFQGVGVIGGIPISDINVPDHVITVVDENSFTITVATSATSTASSQDGIYKLYFSNMKRTANKRITGMAYFQNFIVVAFEDGKLFRVNSRGFPLVIFDSNIAAAQSVSAWSDHDLCTFAVFDGKLIACNGVDKPLIIDFDVTPPTQWCQYLVDIPSGSNTNTPIAQYVKTAGDFLLMAGDPSNPDRLHISNQGSSGTWAGDAAPNNALQVDLGGRLATSQFDIRGISRFRDRVIIGFDENNIIGQLGIFDGSDHVPNFDDLIEEHGMSSHNSALQLGNDLLTVDNIGIASLVRSSISTLIRPARVSELIQPEITNAVVARTVAAMEQLSFALFNARDRQYMLFVPQEDVYTNTVDSLCYVYTVSADGRLKLWSKIIGWAPTAGTISPLKRSFFAIDGNIYFYFLPGDFADNGPSPSNENIYSDFVGDYDDYWEFSKNYSVGDLIIDHHEPNGVVDIGNTQGMIENVGTEAAINVYRCLVAHTSASSSTFEADRANNPTYWELAYTNGGDAIDFEWELPWADFDKRMNTKQVKYINFDTKGDGEFTLKIFADYDETNPAVQMDFVGGEVVSPATGERPTDTQGLFYFPVEFQIGKINISGSHNKDLRISSIQIGYTEGAVGR